MKVIIPPLWKEWMTSQKRLKIAFGGRCVHKDTLIDTVKGRIRIKDFKGGEVYSYDNENNKVIKTTSSESSESGKEKLYTVKLSNGDCVVVTMGHRFLTTSGYVDLRNINIGDAISFSSESKGDYNLLGSNLVSYLLGLHEDVQNYFQKLLNCQDDYLEYYHLYGQQLHQVLNTYQSFLPLQDDDKQHNYHALSHKDEMELFYKYNLSSFLCLPSNYYSLHIEGCKNYEDLGSYTFCKFFEQFLELHQVQVQYLLKIDLVLQNKELSLPSQVYDNLLDLIQNFQKVFDKLFFFVLHKSLINPPRIDNVVKVVCISYHSLQTYYDITVPKYSNYLSCGSINHNSSGKSYTIALMLLILGTTKTLRILCAREYQNSLKESVYANLKEICADINGLGYFYEFKRDSVVGRNGTTFMFAGLQNPDSIKSMSSINYVWIEEGQSVSEKSWEILEPTIRPSKAMVKNNEPCEIWVSMNPDSIDDVLYKLISSGRDDMLTLNINYMDNPFNPEIMLKLAQQTKEEDEDKYKHVWLGYPRSSADSIIYAGRWEELEFEIDNYDGVPQFKDEIIELRYGFDWGFSNPSAVIECFVHDRCLYIHNEIYKNNMSAEDITTALKKHMKQAFNPSSLRTGDSNNPGMISQLSKFRQVDCVEYDGIDITPAKKGDGSVKEGINFIRDGLKRIYVHPRCVNTIHELKTYSYKLDKDGNPTDHVRKEFDHLCFSGDTLVEVNGIVQRIDSIPESGFVKGYDGKYTRYTNGVLTGCKKLLRVEFNDGNIVRCTDDHKFLTTNGWIEAKDIKGEKICTIQDTKDINTQKTIVDTIEEQLRSMEKIKLHTCTEKCTKSITEKYLKVIMSIILIIIKKIMYLKTCVSYLKASIYHITLKSFIEKTLSLQLNILKRTKRNVENGTQVKKEKNGTKNIIIKCVINSMKRLKKSVKAAVKSIWVKKDIDLSSVVMRANQRREEIAELIILQLNASAVGKNSQKTNTLNQLHVVEAVQIEIEQEKSNTYCLKTKDGCFSLANGLIVSNCDSMRYAVEDLTLSYYSNYDWVKDVDIDEFEENNNFIY